MDYTVITLLNEDGDGTGIKKSVVALSDATSVMAVLGNVNCGLGKATKLLNEAGIEVVSAKQVTTDPINRDFTLA